MILLYRLEQVLIVLAFGFLIFSVVRIATGHWPWWFLRKRSQVTEARAEQWGKVQDAEAAIRRTEDAPRPPAPHTPSSHMEG